MKTTRELPHIGWREWLSLPDLGVEWLKCKVDTGARSSAIHAHDIQDEMRDGVPWVRFRILPYQGSRAGVVKAEAELLDRRAIRSSSGTVQTRCVIRTNMLAFGELHSIELTLANRDSMGFRMLVGREAIRNKFVVDPGRSYLSGRPPREIRRIGRRPKS